MLVQTKDLVAVAQMDFGFDDIFSSFFGGGGGSRRRDPNAPRKGSDLQYSMTIEFEEAVFGKEKEIEVAKEENCDTCSGSRCKTWHTPRKMFTL